MTYNTLNPMPSFDPRDLDDNAQAFDRFLQSANAAEPDRFGQMRKTWHQMELDAAALVAPNVAALAAVTPAVDEAVFFNAIAPVGMGTYTLNAFNRSLGATADGPAFRAAIGALAATDTGAYSGSAARLTTARNLTVTGDASWSVSFDGSANAASTLTLAATGVDAGSYSEVTVDAKGRVTAGVSNPSFTALTLQNSWIVIASRRAAYRKISDMVQIEINISGGTAADATTLFTLPLGFRPAFPVVLPVSSGTNAAIGGSVPPPRVLIDTDGTVKCFNCSNAPGISFLTTFATV